MDGEHVSLKSARRVAGDLESELAATTADRDRYEKTLRAIKSCTLTGTDFGDWVQSICEDVLEGLEPECWNCGTYVHDGPCAGGGESCPN